MTRRTARSAWISLAGMLYDGVLWSRSLDCYSRLVAHFGHAERAAESRRQTDFVRTKFLATFWPTTRKDEGTDGHGFTDTQYSLGDARYLVAQVSPFSWRCDVCGNLLAFLTGLLNPRRAMMTFRFLWGTGVNDPGPVTNLYPPVQAGDPEWRSYYTVNLLNLPNHYHNGGLWPFIGSMWVRFIHRLDMPELAQRELVKLAKTCQLGMSAPWEFNEWHHGVTGRPMGKAYQAWSAAGFIRACHDLEAAPAAISHAIRGMGRSPDPRFNTTRGGGTLNQGPMAAIASFCQRRCWSCPPSDPPSSSSTTIPACAARWAG